MAWSCSGVAMLRLLKERASRNCSSSISPVDFLGGGGNADGGGAGLVDLERMRSSRFSTICRCRLCSLDVALASLGVDIEKERKTEEMGQWLLMKENMTLQN